ncbi:MAG: flagellar motor switch protein FliG [Pseudohongiella sp.]|nr:flagellar motor switch protein FliG [Pseudohongiella sp.]MDO9519530.1 flagellar motor switch protein FliG [Pseudohongiella sp.]MDP2127462.1 flagellar motor switch protein FliG [Pseudohongiella sp.]
MAEKNSVDKVGRNISSLERAAILLMSMGEKDAAEILKQMGPKEVQKVGSAMSALKSVSQDAVSGVLSQFLQECGNQSGLGVGAENYIRNMLTEALGEERARGFLDRILLGGSSSGINSLKWMDSRSVADVIRNEHPQIQAVVLSYLEPDQSASILANFPEKVRTEIMMRIASLESVQPDALKELNLILEKQFSGKGSNPSTTIGGTKTAAEIMNNLDGAVEQELMQSIKNLDEDLGNQIQDLMFVFDNLREVDDRGIQSLLREVSSEVLILALKGADDFLKEKFFANMSKRAAELLRDDLEAKGPVRIIEVEAAQKEILVVARRMADAGEIQLGGGGEAMI